MKLPYLLKKLQHLWCRESYQAAPFTLSAKRQILFTTDFFKVLLDFGGTNCDCLFLCLTFFGTSAANRNSNNPIIRCHRTTLCPTLFSAHDILQYLSSSKSPSTTQDFVPCLCEDVTSLFQIFTKLKTMFSFWFQLLLALENVWKPHISV